MGPRTGLAGTKYRGEDDSDLFDDSINRILGDSRKEALDILGSERGQPAAGEIF